MAFLGGRNPYKPLMFIYYVNSQRPPNTHGPACWAPMPQGPKYNCRQKRSQQEPFLSAVSGLFSR